MEERIDTPWGRSDSAHEHGPGVVFYDAPSHGGVRVDVSRVEEINEHLRKHGQRGQDCLWFEEDVAISIPVVTWPDYFKGCDVQLAHRTLKNAWPRDYEKAFGVTVGVDESFMLRRERFQSVHANDFVTVAAWGDWDAQTPEGMVRVLAFRGGRLPNGMYPDQPERFFLVPKDEYYVGENGFVVDLERHQEITDQIKAPA